MYNKPTQLNELINPLFTKGDSKITTYQSWQDIHWACTLELCAHLPTKKQILELACGYYLENIFFRKNN